MVGGKSVKEEEGEEEEEDFEGDVESAEVAVVTHQLYGFAGVR